MSTYKIAFDHYHHAIETWNHHSESKNLPTVPSQDVLD